MSVPRPGSGEHGLAAVRQLLAGALLLGMAGTALELLLIGHYEGVAQWAPTILLAIGLLSFTWMLREFKEYRPYKAIDQFRREIGKYVSKDEVARLERYVVIK